VVGEQRGLRWGHVEWQATIHVRRNIPQHGVEPVPKGGKVRSVPLTDRAAEVLDGLSRRGGWTSDADFVFVHALGGPVDAGHLPAALRAEATPADSPPPSSLPASRQSVRSVP
jgi:integrase